MVRGVQPPRGSQGPQSVPPSPAQQVANMMSALQKIIAALQQNPNDPGLQDKLETAITKFKNAVDNMDQDDYNQVMSDTTLQDDFDSEIQTQFGKLSFSDILSNPANDKIESYFTAFADDKTFASGFNNDMTSAISEFKKLS